MQILQLIFLIFNNKSVSTHIIFYIYIWRMKEQIRYSYALASHYQFWERHKKCSNESGRKPGLYGRYAGHSLVSFITVSSLDSYLQGSVQDPRRSHFTGHIFCTYKSPKKKQVRSNVMSQSQKFKIFWKSPGYG